MNEEIKELIEALEKGVSSMGASGYDDIELFNIDDADERMYEASVLIRKLMKETP